ncbi:MAG: metalloregulator ArsR/SmtB family transcription factor [FCB group bacterium]|jgi:ArsR family transcriptional regulator|nr:metalloregulator ArsR/SmtB family transcription factor [FCB group bacterium]
MECMTLARMQARARVVKALAHPTRLFIVDELTKGERCVCELTEMIGVDISTVSKHLAVLKSARLVQDERRGLLVYYTLKTPIIKDFIDCIEAVLRASAEEQYLMLK